MLTRKTILAVAAVAAFSALGTIATPASARPHVDIHFSVPPPPLRYEVIPAPRYGHVWVPGYWDARYHHRHGPRHHWVNGYWVPARHGYYYNPPYWVERGGHWYHHPGKWDRDGDGVPNRYDRYPRNPYRR